MCFEVVFIYFFVEIYYNNNVLCCSLVTIDDVYKDVLEQAENFKKYA